MSAGAAVVNASFHVQSSALALPVRDEGVRYTSVALSISGVDAPARVHTAGFCLYSVVHLIDS